jgi:dTDP-4-dehydrorhamnose reductase
MKKLAWITGAGGLIGNYFVRTAPQFAADWTIAALTRQELDLTNAAAVRERFRRDNPQLIIHCAALSKVPACDANPKLARQLNVDVTALLAEIAAEIPFFFFSTDLVFDGRKGNYVETDATHPLSIYGETKVAAEKIVLQNPRHVVIRTSMNCGGSPTGDRGFSDELRQSWARGEVTKLFADEFRCPMFAGISARAVWELASQNVNGVFHLAGSERLSRLQIGQLVAEHCAELEPKIEAGFVRDYRGAPRPEDTSMNCSKIQKLLSFPLPGFAEWLIANSHELLPQQNALQ